MKKIYTFFVIMVTINALPQSGNLDGTFGNNGKVHTGFGAGSSIANAIAVQPDGKIIAAGSTYTANTVNSWESDSNNSTLVRYNTNGTIDTTFGNDGIAMTDLYNLYHTDHWNGVIYSIKLQSDGKILTYGSAYQPWSSARAILLRYNIDGSLDNSFGINGKVDCNSSAIAGNHTLIIQPDGKIIAAGAQFLNPSPGVYTSQFVVERYNSDGTYDTAFATEGRAVTAFGSGHDTVKAIGLQPDGKIIAVGTSFNNNFAIARYTVNGVLDNTFDGDGKLIASFGAGTYGVANFVTIRPDGKILIAGISGTNTEAYFTLARYNTNGSIDTGFDGDGKATNLFAASDISRSINSVTEQPDGKFLVTTTANPYGSFDQTNDFLIRSYNSDATTDPAFGVNGIATATLQNGFNEAKDFAIQSNGKIVVAGYSHLLQSDQNNFNVVRYEANGNLDQTFGLDGKATATFDSTNDENSILLIQPDQKLIAIGTKRNHTSNGYLFKDIVLSRYNSDGSLDHAFGDSGKVLSISNGNINTIRNGMLQPDGKIIVSNTYYNTAVDNLYHYELIRYETNGSLDLAFGTNGKTTLNVQTNTLLVQPDGKIIAIGTGVDPQDNPAIILQRLNNNGILDNSFDGDGTAVVSGVFYGTTAAAIQPDGKIVISASSADANGSIGFYVKRLNPDGSLDTVFSTDIKVIGLNCEPFAVFPQPDGKILVAGRSFSISEGYAIYKFVVARYNTNGSLDATYGSDGITGSFLGGPYDPYSVIQSVVYQPDGKFLVALSKVDQNPANPNPDSYDFVIYRFDAEGNYDPDFGSNGQLTTAFYNKYDEVFSMILQPDNKIVVAGTTDTGINRDFALARYDNTIVLKAQDFNLKPGLVLYPNPAKNIINIKFPGQDLKTVNVTIYNMFGQTVFNDGKSSAKINVSNLQTGIYQLKVATDKGNWTGKFIKD